MPYLWSTTFPAAWLRYFMVVQFSLMLTRCFPAHGSPILECDEISAPLELPNVAALRGYSARLLKSGTVALVNGYYKSGDNGGGRFRWESGSTAAANGITVFTPDDGTGRWLRIYHGAVFLEWAGGGATAAQSQNDAAFTAALALGGNLQLMAGDYAVGKTIRITHPRTHIAGLGRGITRIVNNEATPTFYGVEAENIADVSLADFTYVMNGIPVETASVLSFYLYGVAHLRLLNLGFSGCMARIDHCNDSLIEGCHCASSSYAAFGIAASERVAVRNNFATRCTSGVQTEAAFDVKIVDNTIVDTFCEGIRVEDSQRVSVKRNRLLLCQYGITVYGPKSGFDLYTQDIVVSDNTFDRCYRMRTASPFSSRSYGYVMDARGYVRHVRFTGNLIIGKANASTLISDFSADTAENPAFADTVANEAIASENPYSLAHSGHRIYVRSNAHHYGPGWYARVNIPDGKDFDADRSCSVDLYWHSPESMDNSTLGVRFYSKMNGCGAVLGTCDLYNSGVHFRVLPVRFTVPPGIGKVECVEFYLKKDIADVAFFVLSEFRQGLEARIAYVHDWLNGDISDVQLRGNQASNVTYPVPLTFPFPISLPNMGDNSWDIGAGR